MKPASVYGRGQFTEHFYLELYEVFRTEKETHLPTLYPHRCQDMGQCLMKTTETSLEAS